MLPKPADQLFLDILGNAGFFTSPAEMQGRGGDMVDLKRVTRQSGSLSKWELSVKTEQPRRLLNERHSTCAKEALQTITSGRREIIRTRPVYRV
jgi:hypothetical protein